ncbi:MAG TPA: glycosyltransferase family 4 protein [Dehalococcoidia bacterium]|nr:glycosyltransferase family 4 protein [Dehalococcoidia bacterium]
MRILLITALDVWALSGQGGAPSLHKTLQAYGQRGHLVDVVSPTIGANHHHGAPPVPPPELEGVTFHQFHLPSLGESRVPWPDFVLRADQKLRFAALFPWLASRRALQTARGRAYDLLYGYEVHGVLAQRLVRRRLPLPLVARFQGTIMHPYLDSRLQLLRRYEEVLALRTPADLYVMTNDGTRGAEVLARLNPASAGKVRFWRNGLDLRHIRPPTEAEAEEARAALGLAPDDIVLVTAARLARWKRIDRAIDALALLRREVTRARLIVVGDGEERTNLEALARDRGVAPAVTFTGAVPQAEVQRYLWAADIFLSLNELSNVGNPLLEAMSAGRCILTLDEGDTADLIRDGETGVLLPASGEPSRIARALASLASDRERRRRLGEAAARLAAREFWSWQDRLNAELREVEALVGRAVSGAATRV